MRAARNAVSAIALAALASPAASQGAEEMFEPGQYLIEGVPAYCPEVTTLVRGRATTLIEAPDGLTIVINGPVFDTLAPGIRLFVYYQTCANMGYRDQGLADGFAALHGVTQMWLSAADVEAICLTDLLTRAGWAATPDAGRCEAIYATMRGALR